MGYYCFKNHPVETFLFNLKGLHFRQSVSL